MSISVHLQHILFRSLFTMIRRDVLNYLCCNGVGLSFTVDGAHLWPAPGRSPHPGPRRLPWILLYVFLYPQFFLWVLNAWPGLPSMRPHCSTPGPTPSPQRGRLGSRCWLSLALPSQFWERCKLFLMPAKHQPDHAFLRHVPLRRIHLFTLVQILCLAVLWVLKSTMAAIIFPVMVRWGWLPSLSDGCGLGGGPRGGPPHCLLPDGLSHWASTGHDWGCESRPGGTGKQTDRQGKKVCVVGGRVLRRQFALPPTLSSDCKSHPTSPTLGQDGGAGQVRRRLRSPGPNSNQVQK